ncbi:Hsp20/alpha crystallin family protein [Legionella hackeliae]|uniref:Putative Heat shock protein, Hsp20 family n=1 Tax=Legionella hackeliae TaxID=449 RepID=A0A0A8US08_LEGHA|nr:Hsp20 family protein [Legionella hackeliae]CEK11600.1 putative Heat shock protein, Hsp20 family [Legionella hackeliae]STX48370.1 heat shock protein, Hsp20 family [Legionella hackeliae]
MFNLQSDSYPFYRNLGLTSFFGSEPQISSTGSTRSGFPISNDWSSAGMWPLNSRFQFTYTTPRTDFVEGTDSYEFFMDVPGCSSDRLFITFDRLTLTVKGHPSHSNSENFSEDRERHHVWFSERSRTGFFRQFTLPSVTANQHVLATLKDGLLHIVIKKDLSEDNGRVEVTTL